MVQARPAHRRPSAAGTGRGARAGDRAVRARTRAASLAGVRPGAVAFHRRMPGRARRRAAPARHRTHAAHRRAAAGARRPAPGHRLRHPVEPRGDRQPADLRPRPRGRPLVPVERRRMDRGRADRRGAPAEDPRRMGPALVATDGRADRRGARAARRSGRAGPWPTSATGRARAGRIDPPRRAARRRTGRAGHPRPVPGGARRRLPARHVEPGARLRTLLAPVAAPGLGFDLDAPGRAGSRGTRAGRAPAPRGR